MSDELQRTDEWFAARLGKATASRMADITATLRGGGYGASRSNYMAELVLERITGNPTQGFTSAAMQWGTDTEPLARAAYEWREGAVVEEVGFVGHPAIEMAGASPDGLVGADGMLEIKAPQAPQHLATILGEPIKDRYLQQMQWQMACAGPDRKWCDFVSFNPLFPERMSYFRQRIERDQVLINDLEREVDIFLSDLADTVRQLEERYPE